MFRFVILNKVLNKHQIDRLYETQWRSFDVAISAIGSRHNVAQCDILLNATLQRTRFNIEYAWATVK